MPKEQSPESNGKIREQIESDKFKLAVASVLPAHVTPARFVRISIAALTRVPKLAECDPNTVLQCLMQLSQFGLEPDGRNAHLIPFWNSKRSVMECQLIVDYKGLVDLAMRSGKVAFVHADKVCENDVFVWNKGQVVKHEINFKEDRGKPYAYYAIARMKDGTEQAEAMTRQDVEGIRKRSRAANNGPWVTDFDEMAKKTVFRRLSKWLQLSPEYREALEADADAIEELRFDNAKPVISRAKVPKLKDVSGEQSDEATSNSTSGGGQKPDVAGQPEGNAHQAVPAQSSEKKTKLAVKKKIVPSSDAHPNLTEISARLLANGFKTPIELIELCRENDWIDKDEEWPLSEERLEKFLDGDNWQTILGALQKAKE